MFHMKHSLVTDGLFNWKFLTSTIVSHETIIIVLKLLLDLVDKRL